MSTRTVYLLVYPGRRFHFGIWIPDSEGSSIGTKTQVVGNPMVGFALQFKRKYTPGETVPTPTAVTIGKINEQHVPSFEGEKGDDTLPRNDLERIAATIPPPRPSKNFMAPVNDTTNRRCQEWTMDFVKQLVEIGYLDEEAVQIVQERRNKPDDGIALQAVEGFKRDY